MSLREYFACVEAHNEEVEGTKRKPKPMSKERLERLNLGENITILDFKGPANGN